MSSLVRNKLTIQCENIELLDKIRTMVLRRNDDNVLVFALSNFLPFPIEFSGKDAYDKYGYYWYIANWGTKGDAYNSLISEDDTSFSILYETPGRPNIEWTKALCHYIEVVSSFAILKGEYKVYVSHSFYEGIEDLHGKIEWSSQNGYKYFEGEIIDSWYD